MVPGHGRRLFALCLALTLSANPPAAAWQPMAAAPAGSPVDCAGRVLTGLHLSERVGQLFMVSLGGVRLTKGTRDVIAHDHFGSVTFVGSTTLGVDAVAAITARIQQLATVTPAGTVGLFVAANQEGGLVQPLRGPGFGTMPSAVVQGTLAPSTLRNAARGWGSALGAAGVNLDLAPVGDTVPPGVTWNAPIGQLDREFGHDPTTVADHVRAFIRGMRDAGVATVVKHFPGLGRVRGNTDFTRGVTDTVTTRHDSDLGPFRTAIAAHVPMVMVSLARYERIDRHHLAAFSRTIVTGMLRTDLGFRGVIVSDSLSAAAVQGIPVAIRALDFIRAGGDMIVVTNLSQAATMAQALIARAKADASFRRLVDASVRRILTAKAGAGLLTCQ